MFSMAVINTGLEGLRMQSLKKGEVEARKGGKGE